MAISRIYGQKNSRILINGKQITGFMDGATIKVSFDGGEVDKTEGTDGPGLNVATDQGGTISFTLRETTNDYQYLLRLWKQEEQNVGYTINCTFMSGSQIVLHMPRALISRPGELNTGDKKQGGIEFRVIGDSIG